MERLDSPTFSDAYGSFGRAYFLVPLGLLLGMSGLYALRRANPGQQATEQPDEETLSIVMSIVGLVTALVGSILDYWGGGSGVGFTQVQITGFGLEMVGLLLVLLGSTLLGLQYRRANVVPVFLPGCSSPPGRVASCCPSWCTCRVGPCSCFAAPGW